MSVAIVTGSSGLIGSETVGFLHDQGMTVVGLDNDMRAYFFGPEASTSWNTERLKRLYRRFIHTDLDVRDQDGVFRLFTQYGHDVTLVVHTAAQPSHDWAAREPFTDFTINANGTLNLLEATRRFCPDATFIFTSTNKVYGDTPNRLPLIEHETRWELSPEHPYAEHGIDESMTIDHSMHSLFGASKVAADVLTQEYGRYFGLKTGIFRGGCLTGPLHAGAELHGFLAYLVKCAVTGTPYTIYGYKGKQVRDNIHSFDLVNAFWHFFQHPQEAAVYNIGGSRFSHCSVLEAIELVQQMCGREVHYTLSDQARAGDHIWWISDVRKFQRNYPQWTYQYDLKRILQELIDHVSQRVADGVPL
ncbi:MAG: NAD-dependent epimerase/dehydratase family protein [Acidobacteriota bacterium]|nr:NAD-dependent epimerase/dehydratase family protein [Blastocatellia bacterium]MDW8240520.1 NAD-dependent epimerase/dehydratase family protein [Acidobacteriota bacterium]